MGRPFAAALFVTLTCAAAPADVLRVEGPGGAPLFEHAAPEGAEICLSWNHSVTGGAVADCFVNDGGRMVLMRSYLHDFAAGLGEVQGRGTLRSAEGGGYWIEDMNDPIPDNRLPLRVGRPSTDHRLRIGGDEYKLSQIAAGERVVLHLIHED
ncbi:hypothetical protein SAMN04488047_112136 [Tranquillimonas alkanivorans]|uniref:DUF1850 domain-containing protein n=2 Tax=Tranquillimonas alkanivorans TaxID=441119 RepID=A0A1I5T4A3_9RHOB|nr:hypothetical protein SAMN04488047_112136 [Tranquillimonas alkanivorans]